MENGHIKLKVTEVTKNYGEKCILDHVTFDVYDGWDLRAAARRRFCGS